MLNLIISARRAAISGVFDFPDKRFYYRYKAPRGLLLSFIIQMQIGVAHCIIKTPCKNVPRSHRGRNNIKINSMHIIENNVLNNKIGNYIARIHICSADKNVSRRNIFYDKIMDSVGVAGDFYR
jgi:hypothetical protein